MLINKEGSLLLFVAPIKGQQWLQRLATHQVGFYDKKSHFMCPLNIIPGSDFYQQDRLYVCCFICVTVNSHQTLIKVYKTEIEKPRAAAPAVLLISV